MRGTRENEEDEEDDEEVEDGDDRDDPPFAAALGALMTFPGAEQRTLNRALSVVQETPEDARFPLLGHQDLTSGDEE